MKKIILILTCLSLFSCPIPEPPKSDPELRRQIFFECLKNIPKGPEKVKYNDWAEVIEACDNAAYWMSKKRNEENTKN